MKKYLLGLIILCSTVNVFSLEKNVLVIHSYHQGLEWSDSISNGIISVLNNFPELRVHFEYLDTKRNTSNIYLKSFVELYRSRTSNIKYDAIIAADNAAFDFMINYRDEFYPNVPVFYCGVSYLDYLQIKDINGFYGFSENPDHKGTIDLIMNLFPERKKILIINDKTLTGRKVRQELDSLLFLYNDKLEFEIIDDFFIDELEERVSQLSDDYTIYLLAINKDRNGNYLSFKHGIKIIKESSNVPIFGSWDFYLRKGIVGGQISHGMDQGRDVAQLAYNYISNKNTNPPVIQKGRTRLCLDFNMLEQYNISKRSIPKNAIIINKPKLTAKQVLGIKIGIGTILFLVFVYFYIQRKVQAKKLKKLVEKRTYELKTTNKELEKINQSKNEIISIVAHDLRNPIGNINAFSKLMLEREAQNLSQKNLDKITYINDISSYMLRLADNLLDISVIESGVLKLDLNTLDYVSFIKAEVQKNRATASHKNISIEINCPNTEIILNFDEIKIQQVINNLISNALKYSDSGDIINISVMLKDNIVLTSVKDMGPGISKKDFEDIFRKFAQLKTNKVSTEKGTGLGLSIVKGIIEAHGGKIYVKSDLNNGAEFIYELPVLNL